MIQELQQAVDAKQKAENLLTENNTRHLEVRLIISSYAPILMHISSWLAMGFCVIEDARLHPTALAPLADLQSLYLEMCRMSQQCLQTTWFILAESKNAGELLQGFVIVFVHTHT